MVRVFGLLLAAVALVAPANAALLTYNFNNNVSGVADPSSMGGSGTDLSRTTGDNLLSDKYQTTAVGASATTTNFFSFTAGGYPTVLTDVNILGRRAGTGSIAVKVSYQIGSGPILDIDTANPTGGENANKFAFLDGNGDPTTLLLAPSQTITFFIATTQTGSGTARYEMNNLDLNGSAVPEPASMAIFGLMGAGLAVRRFRRK